MKGCQISDSHSGDYEERCLLGCNAVQYGRSSELFRRNIVLHLQVRQVSQSSHQHEAGRKQGCLLLAGYLLGVRFDREDGEGTTSETSVTSTRLHGVTFLKIVPYAMKE
jgi:hypothetical protein